MLQRTLVFVWLGTRKFSLPTSPLSKEGILVCSRSEYFMPRTTI